MLTLWCLLPFTGTTCATVLTRAIFAEGCKSVAAGMNAMDLRRGITMAVDSVVTNLKSRARMISTSEEIAQVLSLAIICCILAYDILTQLYFDLLLVIWHKFIEIFKRDVSSLLVLQPLAVFNRAYNYIFRLVQFPQMGKEKLASWLQRLWRKLARKEWSQFKLVLGVSCFLQY